MAVCAALHAGLLRDFLREAQERQLVGGNTLELDEARISNPIPGFHGMFTVSY